MARYQGMTTLGFDYLDGKLSNAIAMTTSSNSKELDKASLGAVTKASMPPVPSAYEGKSMHIQVLFCYTLYTSLYGSTPSMKNQCPTQRNMIVVHGIRIKSTTVRTAPSTRG